MQCYKIFLSIFLCGTFFLCDGQELQRQMPERRLVEKRLRVPLTVKVPPIENDLKNLPERCLPTPLKRQGGTDKDLPSVPLAPTGVGRFSWTPDTPPTWKNPFLWLKESTGKLIRYVFD